jgi:hypothetical protein
MAAPGAGSHDCPPVCCGCSQGNRIFYRLQEFQHRPQILTRARALIKRARKDVASWRESRPWVNETEYEKLLDKVAGFEKWLDDKEGQQAKRALTEDPAFSCADVDAKATELLKKVGLPSVHRLEDSRDWFKLLVERLSCCRRCDRERRASPAVS